MIKSILVPVAGVDSDRHHLLAALSVARRFQAHLDVLHVRPDATQLAASAASAAYESVVLMGALLQQLEKDAQDRFATANETFAAFIKSENLEVRERPAGTASATSVTWLTQTGVPNEGVACSARLHDLVVAGRSRDAQEGTSGTLEAALVDGGRPVLIVPQGATQVHGRTVVIAWKDSAEAARAALAAGPFLAQADRVEVVAVSENGAEDRETVTRLADGLAWHDIKANARVVPSGDRSGADALLATVRDLDGDLVVMGAYGHSRVREMIFGGFTRHILRGADVPVLMFH